MSESKKKKEVPFTMLFKSKDDFRAKFPSMFSIPSNREIAIFNELGRINTEISVSPFREPIKRPIAPSVPIMRNYVKQKTYYNETYSLSESHQLELKSTRDKIRQYNLHVLEVHVCVYDVYKLSTLNNVSLLSHMMLKTNHSQKVFHHRLMPICDVIDAVPGFLSYLRSEMPDYEIIPIDQDNELTCFSSTDMVQ